MNSSIKDSGIEYIGKIPEEWDIQKIKIFSDIFGRIGFRGYTVNDLVDEGEGAITLNPSNIENQKLKLDQLQYISWFKYDESPEIKIYNNDILLVKTASVGKVAFVENLNDPTTINPQLVVFKNIKINPKYFYYCLVSSVIQTQIDLNLNGGVLLTLSQENIRNYYCVVPDEKTQENIVKFLDKKIKIIDDKIDKLKELIEKYNEYKQSLITEIVTKGLNSDVEFKYSGIDWIEKIPAHWKTDYLKYRVILNGSTLTDKTDDNYEFKYVDIGSVSFEKGIEKYETMLFKDAPSRARRIVKKDDVIISTVRTYLKAIAIIPDEKDLIVSTGFAVLTPTKINSRYLGYVVKSEYFINLVSANSVGVLYPSINSNKLINFMIVIPPDNEQEEIADYLDKKISPIDFLITEKEKLVNKLEEYKTSIIFEYVTGKKEV